MCTVEAKSFGVIIRIGSFQSITVKTKPRFGECYTCFGCENKTEVVRILVVFQDRPMFGHIIQKVSARAFH